jgi:hypothetical protein
MTPLLAQVATANEGEWSVGASRVAIVEDVTDHPQSPITRIAQRTGLEQSLVSQTVDRLQTLGVLAVGHGPADGWRTLVRVDPQARGWILPSGLNARSRMRSVRWQE